MWTISRARPRASSPSSCHQCASLPPPDADASVSPEPSPAVNIPPRPDAPNEMTDTLPNFGMVR